MDYNDLKLGMLIRDTWYGDWGIGRVVRIKKTVIKVAFPQKTIVYDKPHVQFLERAQGEHDDRV